MTKITTVGDYIDCAAELSQPIMHQLRRIICELVPEATETIAWNVPIYKLSGTLVGFAVYSKHVSLGFSEGGLSDAERKLFEDAGYKTGKGTIQIKFGQEVPVEIIEKVLLAHVDKNLEKEG